MIKPTDQIDGWVRSIASYGLPGSNPTVPDAPLSQHDWSALRYQTITNRMPAFLALSVADGMFPATDEQIADAMECHAQAAALMVNLDRTLLDQIELLGAAGVDYRALKGSAVAHLDYPDPSLRSYGDVDLLVRSDQWEQAVAAFTEVHGERRYPEPRPGFDRRFGKGTSFSTHLGHEIDLHRTFVAGAFGLTIKPDDFFASSQTFSIGGVPVLALGPTERFLHSAVHAALGNVPPRLSALRDVAQSILSNSIDLNEVRRRATEWQIEPVLARAVVLAWHMLDIADMVPLSTWAQHFEPDRDQQRNLDAYTSEDRSYATVSLTALKAIDGVGNKAAYLRAMVLPDRSYLTGRDNGFVDRWRRLVRTAGADRP